MNKIELDNYIKNRWKDFMVYWKLQDRAWFIDPGSGKKELFKPDFYDFMQWIIM